MLRHLIERGDNVSITDGLLRINPQSGKPIPDDWLEKNQPDLIAEIAQELKLMACQITGHSTGFYEGGRHSGLALQFVDIVTGENPHAIFNVDLKRSRNSKAGKKGEPLPAGRFNITKNYSFYKFWDRTKIKHPRRLSEYHEHIGKLRTLYFTMELNEKGKAENEAVRPLVVTHEAIASALKTVDFSRQLLGNFSARARQGLGNNARQGSGTKPEPTCLADDSKYGFKLLR